MGGTIIQFPGKSRMDIYRMVMEEGDKFDKLMEEESERGIIIVGAAQIDEYMKGILEKQFVPKAWKKKDELLDAGGPLSSANARVGLVYRLGLISKQFRQAIIDLQAIRNKFAHDVEIGKDLYEEYPQEIINFLSNFKDNEQIMHGEFAESLEEYEGTVFWNKTMVKWTVRYVASCLRVLERLVPLVEPKPMDLFISLPEEE